MFSDNDATEDDEEIYARALNGSFAAHAGVGEYLAANKGRLTFCHINCNHLVSHKNELTLRQSVFKAKFRMLREFNLLKLFNFCNTMERYEMFKCSGCLDLIMQVIVLMHTTSTSCEERLRD
jgi:hypothetical protein